MKHEMQRCMGAVVLVGCVYMCVCVCASAHAHTHVKCRTSWGVLSNLLALVPFGVKRNIFWLFLFYLHYIAFVVVKVPFYIHTHRNSSTQTESSRNVYRLYSGFWLPSSHFLSYTLEHFVFCHTWGNILEKTVVISARFWASWVSGIRQCFWFIIFFWLNSKFILKKTALKMVHKDNTENFSPICPSAGCLLVEAMLLLYIFIEISRCIFFLSFFLFFLTQWCTLLYFLI